MLPWEGEGVPQALGVGVVRGREIEVVVVAASELTGDVLVAGVHRLDLHLVRGQLYVDGEVVLSVVLGSGFQDEGEACILS